MIVMNIFGIVLGWVREYVDDYNNYVMARQEVEDSYQMIIGWRRKPVNIDLINSRFYLRIILMHTVHYGHRK